MTSGLWGQLRAASLPSVFSALMSDVCVYREREYKPAPSQCKDSPAEMMAALCKGYHGDHVSHAAMTTQSVLPRQSSPRWQNEFNPLPVFSFNGLPLQPFFFLPRVAVETPILCSSPLCLRSSVQTQTSHRRPRDCQTRCPWWLAGGTAASQT